MVLHGDSSPSAVRRRMSQCDHILEVNPFIGVNDWLESMKDMVIRFSSRGSEHSEIRFTGAPPIRIAEVIYEVIFVVDQAPRQGHTNVSTYLPVLFRCKHFVEVMRQERSRSPAIRSWKPSGIQNGIVMTSHKGCLGHSSPPNPPLHHN